MRTLLLLFCLFGLFINSALSATEVNSRVQVKGKTPEGVIIHKNKVILKKGYVFEKKSNSSVVARMRGGRGGITGEFDCTCNGEQGGCSAVTTPNSVTCVSSGCSSCYMIVTIPDKAGSVLRR